MILVLIVALIFSTAVAYTELLSASVIATRTGYVWMAEAEAVADQGLARQIAAFEADPNAGRVGLQHTTPDEDFPVTHAGFPVEVPMCLGGCATFTGSRRWSVRVYGQVTQDADLLATRWADAVVQIDYVPDPALPSGWRAVKTTIIQWQRR